MVPYHALKDFLTNHIEKTEIYRDIEEDPEDLASEFLEFVKKRAGLLIEIGDNEYSFVHLTFQEYLAASNIATTHERDGAKSIWASISKYRNDDRWLEVIRLLIANLKSDESQAFLVEKFIEASENERRLMKSRLLGGLLLDGIEPAEFRKNEIFQYLLHSAIKLEKMEELGALLTIIRTCLSKENINQSVMYKAFASIWQSLKEKKQKITLILTAVSLNWPETKIRELTGDYLNSSDPDTSLYKIFFTANPDTSDYQCLIKNIERLWHLQDYFFLESAYLNFVSAAYHSIGSSLEEKYTRKTFGQQIVTLIGGVTLGPFLHLNMNFLYIKNKKDSINNYNIVLDRVRARVVNMDLDMNRGRVLDRSLALDRNLDRVREMAWHMDRTRNRDRDLAWDMDRTRALARDMDKIREKSPGNFWHSILTTPKLYGPLLDILVSAFEMDPQSQWWESLRTGFLPKIPDRITLFDESKWKQVEQAFEKDNFGVTDVCSAAWQLMFDSWLYIFGNHNTRKESIFEHLAQLTQNNDSPPLRIAHCIRDLAYGDKSRADDLVSMVKSDDPRYREIFERCYWIPTAEEKKKEQGYSII